MIRAMAVTSLVMLLIIVLYLPAMHPAERLIAQLHREHEVAAQYWEAKIAMQLLDRALRLQGDASQRTPLPATEEKRSASAAGTDAMAAMNQRLMSNSYFRSVDALLLLASYRVAALVQWLPWLALPMGITLIIDAQLQRIVRSKEFRQHHPELFILYLGLGVFCACITVVLITAPLSWHPLLIPTMPIFVLFWLSHAWSHYHRRN